MASNYEAHAGYVDDWLDEDLPDLVVEQHQGAVLGLMDRLFARSPVDTGRFRLNWQLELGGYADGTIDEGAGASESEGGDRETNAANATRIGKAREYVKVPKITEPMFTGIANNLPYAARLNDGWSDQAAAGFVELVVEEVKSAFDREN